jgi:predicted AAA+ superfamily ATPase
MADQGIKEILKEMILDFQSEALALGTPRRLGYEIVPHKAFICIGVRRCGKSTLLFQIADSLEKSGVKRQNILYLNFFDDRLQELRRGNLSVVMEAYFSLFPEKKGTETVYCIFDELQEVHGWEAFVDRILRTEKCEVYISGSSAKLLAKEIASQMRGRSLSWELFPFSYREYLDFKKIETGAATSKNRHTLQKYFELFWETGGFPEVLNVSPKIRIRIHQEYFKTILHRDIIERFDALHPQAVVDAAFRLLGSVGSLYSINRITDYLKSQGHKVSKEFVCECLQWFEDAYFLFSTRLFDASAARRNANPKKIYCIDHSLVHSVVPGIMEDRGHLLETLVFVQIRRETDEIYYYRTARGNEVDFVTLHGKKKKTLIQVCYSLKNEQTRKREVTSLFEAMREMRISRGTIVTFDGQETINDGTLTIDVVPAYKFLLEESD